ncbi:N-carbamoyl-L-amino acid amidohydrolase [Bacillus sp. NRRL B-14911]|uniref:Allantoate amidohydrolase n=1 Tax=Bacillus infantis NRRL B-14911 TaxID=1367477 RepID=U5LI74_9BACI|nr:MULTISPECIES: M20 family metallo-hydrolase [Bacillus]AGX06322.1 allantoate amidohydrolase [Bacillus infantis NRRL B-14911]EAR68754.1 N-carbamoyl-L-amino acid amidohydrolase [Bacillus sp. NRRL B-14911]
MADLNSWLEKNLAILNTVSSMDQPEGFTRLSFTAEEKAAHAAFRKVAEELGLHTLQDAAGNQWAIWKTDSRLPPVAVGSHLDTVVNGGGYDGPAGVLSALAAIKTLKGSGFQPARDIAVVCFVSEESARFGLSTIGSKAVSGKLNSREAGRMTDRNGVTVKEAAEEFGLDWSRIEEAELPAEKLACFLELHIEQGTHIEEHGAEIGIVNGVACPVRLKVRVKGMAGHTGTTPMHIRKDAFVAIAPLVTFVHERASQLSEESIQPLVATVSTVELKPNSMNVIPGEIELGIDIRSVDDMLKRSFAEEIKDFCQKAAADSGVEIHVETLINNDSIVLDPNMQQKLTGICGELGLKAHSMNSGAGHDVMNMAAKWPSGLIFIPCKDGISHHPDEFASIEDMAKGVRVITRFLEKEASL